MIIRSSLEDELDYLQAFLVEQGSNQWNYLPEAGVNEQFQRLTLGSDRCLVAVDNEAVVGMAIYRQPGDVPKIFTNFVKIIPKLVFNLTDSCYFFINQYCC